MAPNTNPSLTINVEFQGKISNKGCMSWKHLLGMGAHPDCSKPFEPEPTKPQQDNYMVEK